MEIFRDLLSSLFLYLILFLGATLAFISYSYQGHLCLLLSSTLPYKGKEGLIYCLFSPPDTWEKDQGLSQCFPLGGADEGVGRPTLDGCILSQGG